MPTDNRLDPRIATGAQQPPRSNAHRGVVLGRKGVFLVGLGSGAFIASHWRSLVKRGIRVAVKSGTKARRMVARGAENVADLTREAMADLEVPEGGRGGKTALLPAPAPHADAPTDAGAQTPS